MTPLERAQKVISLRITLSREGFENAIERTIVEAVAAERKLWEAAVTEVRARLPRDSLVRQACDNIVEAVKRMRER